MTGIPCARGACRGKDGRITARLRKGLTPWQGSILGCAPLLAGSLPEPGSGLGRPGSPARVSLTATVTRWLWV